MLGNGLNPQLLQMIMQLLKSPDNPNAMQYANSNQAIPSFRPSGAYPGAFGAQPSTFQSSSAFSQPFMNQPEAFQPSNAYGQTFNSQPAQFQPSKIMPQALNAQDYLGQGLQSGLLQAVQQNNQPKPLSNYWQRFLQQKKSGQYYNVPNQ